MAVASEAASISKPEQLIIPHIDHDHLFKATAEGNIEPFVGNNKQDFEQIVQEISMDTIPYIYIKSINKWQPTIRCIAKIIHNIFKSKTTMKLELTNTLAEQILDICPSFLLKVNVKDETSLHVSAKFRHRAIVEVLLLHAKAQLDPERGDWQMLRMTNNKNNTALNEAVLYNNRNVVKILTREADPDFSYGADKDGETPLYLAAARGSASMMSHILKGCTSAAHEGSMGKTSLHATVMRNNSSKLDPLPMAMFNIIDR